MCAQRRLRTAWASAQSDQSLRCAHSESLGPKLPFERTAKTLIRSGGCPAWSESSLGTQSFCWFCHEAAHIKESRLKLIELNERYLFFLFNRFLSWHPRHPFFPCYLSRHYENSSHVSCRVKKNTCDDEGRWNRKKNPQYFNWEICFLDFDM